MGIVSDVDMPRSAFEYGPIEHGRMAIYKLAQWTRGRAYIGAMVMLDGYFEPDAELAAALPNLWYVGSQLNWPSGLGATDTQEAVERMGIWDYCFECEHIMPCKCSSCHACDVREKYCFTCERAIPRLERYRGKMVLVDCEVCEGEFGEFCDRCEDERKWLDDMMSDDSCTRPTYRWPSSTSRSTGQYGKSTTLKT